MPVRFPLAVGLVVPLLAGLLLSAGQAVACAPELSESGLGGIAAGTPFDREALARALPGCTVERTAGTSEGEPLGVLVVKDGATPVALVFPDWSGGIFSVLVQGAALRSPGGPALGARFAGVFADLAAPLCLPGVEDSAGRVLCPAAVGGRLAYVFEGRWSGSDGALPSAAELADWRLVAFMWRPTPFEDPRWVDVAGFDPGEGPALAEQVRRAIADPPALARLVLYPITLRASDGSREQAIEIAGPDAFATEYARRLTPGFVAAVRDEPAGQVHLDDTGAALGAGRIRIAPVCLDDGCMRHRSGVVAVSVF